MLFGSNDQRQTSFHLFLARLITKLPDDRWCQGPALAGPAAQLQGSPGNMTTAGVKDRPPADPSAQLQASSNPARALVLRTQPALSRDR